MMKKHLPFLSVLFSTALLFSCGNNEEKTGGDNETVTEDSTETEAEVVATPDEIALSVPGLYPEGVDYDTKNKRYFVTSLFTGNVGTVNDAGEYTLFAGDPAIISAIGVYVDEARDRVLVAGSDPGAGKATSPETQLKTAQLAIFDLNTGKKIKLVDLTRLTKGDLHFANDIAVDDEGNIYVTNSKCPYIYRINDMGIAAIFAQDDQFKVDDPKTQFGLNGIVYHPDGYLLTVTMHTSKLYKIPLDDPSNITEVLDSLPAGPDGLELIDNNQLAVVCNGAAKVALVKTEDNWESANIASTVDTPSDIGIYATTATMRDDALYVLHAKLGALFGGDTSHTEFPIKKVTFE